jgi:DNA-binding GntR family transcriptional regulator
MKHLIDHAPLRSVVAEKIRDMILNGDLTAGERLIEDRIASKLGVSRNPVREAIRLLETSGLVKVEPRKGAYVAELDVEGALKIQELRIVLEAWIISEAAIRHSDADLAKIDKCLELGIAASQEGDLVKASEMHRKFHLAIEDSCNNPFLKSVMDPLRHRTELVFSVVSENRGSVIWEEHSRIRDAIARRKPKLAQSLMVKHIEGSMEAFKKVPNPPVKRL